MPLLFRSYEYADRQLVVQAQDLLASDSEVVVVSNNLQLDATEGLAGRLVNQAGEMMQSDLSQLIREYGSLSQGVALATRAGSLPFKAVIHAVPPDMPEVSDGEEPSYYAGVKSTLEQAVTSSLLLCESNNWNSIAFSALGTGAARVPLNVCAAAMTRAILRFWDVRMDALLERVTICTRESAFQAFIDSVEAENLGPLAHLTQNEVSGSQVPGQSASTQTTGEWELSDSEIQQLDDDDLSDDWFK